MKDWFGAIIAKYFLEHSSISIDEYMTIMRENVTAVVPIKNDMHQLIIDRLYSLDEQDKKYLALDKKWHVIKDNLKRNVHIYTLRIENDVVGMFRESGRPNGFHMLEEFLVFPEYRGRGYSKIMMQFYVDNFPKSYVKTLRENTKMNELLSKYGFKHDDGMRILNWIRE